MHFSVWVNVLKNKEKKEWNKKYISQFLYDLAWEQKKDLGRWFKTSNLEKEHECVLAIESTLTL